MLTGNHTGRAWQRANGDIQFRRDADEIIIATRLKGLGYRTAMIGKSGLASNSDDATPANDKKLDSCYVFIAHGAARRNYPRELVRNGKRIELPGNHGETGEIYANELFVEDARRWIAPESDKPITPHLSLTDAHAVLTVPERQWSHSEVSSKKHLTWGHVTRCGVNGLGMYNCEFEVDLTASDLSSCVML